MNHAVNKTDTDPSSHDESFNAPMKVIADRNACPEFHLQSLPPNSHRFRVGRFPGVAEDHHGAGGCDDRQRRKSQTVNTQKKVATITAGIDLAETAAMEAVTAAAAALHSSVSVSHFRSAQRSDWSGSSAVTEPVYLGMRPSAAHESLDLLRAGRHRNS